MIQPYTHTRTHTNTHSDTSNTYEQNKFWLRLCCSREGAVRLNSVWFVGVKSFVVIPLPKTTTTMLYVLLSQFISHDQRLWLCWFLICVWCFTLAYTFSIVAVISETYEIVKRKLINDKKNINIHVIGINLKHFRNLMV